MFLIGDYFLFSMQESNFNNGIIITLESKTLLAKFYR